MGSKGHLTRGTEGAWTADSAVTIVRHLWPKLRTHRRDFCCGELGLIMILLRMDPRDL